MVLTRLPLCTKNSSISFSRNLLCGRLKEAGNHGSKKAAAHVLPQRLHCGAHLVLTNCPG